MKINNWDEFWAQCAHYQITEPEVREFLSKFTPAELIEYDRTQKTLFHTTAYQHCELSRTVWEIVCENEELIKWVHDTTNLARGRTPYEMLNMQAAKSGLIGTAWKRRIVEKMRYAANRTPSRAPDNTPPKEFFWVDPELSKPQGWLS